MWKTDQSSAKADLTFFETLERFELDLERFGHQIELLLFNIEVAITTALRGWRIIRNRASQSMIYGRASAFEQSRYVAV